MSGISSTRIELIDKHNYDTWKLQMQAILIKADLWEYVNGNIPKPERGEGAADVAREQTWIKIDLKARSDIILSISSTELKQVKNCETSREMWLKLQEIYQSQGPARKATLLKRLTLSKMTEGSDIREHLNSFFDTVDKLGDMDIQINQELLTIMLLYSLPSNFENFRCAIESRDNLPSPESLRTKIIEESDARKSTSFDLHSKAMFTKRNNRVTNKQKFEVKEKFDPKQNTNNQFRCYLCNKIAHKKSECRFNKNLRQTAKCAEKNTKKIQRETSNFMQTESEIYITYRKFEKVRVVQILKHKKHHLKFYISNSGTQIRKI